MNIRLKAGVFAGSIGLAIASLAGVARAADTTTTFTLTGGSLSISAPTSASLGSVATGSATTSAQLGNVSVNDPRGALLGSWTATVSSTDFKTGGQTTNETITKSNADYWSGAGTTTGTGVFTPGQLLAANKQALSTSRTAFSATGIVGNDTASWNPTVVINVPSAAVAGDYTGTVTHSVA